MLAADTVVVLDGRILGKPIDAEDAIRMLSLLQGRTHVVTTAVVVRRGEQMCAGTSSATVRMRPVGQGEIRAYVATGEPMDKAGAYAVQGGASDFVIGVEGCFHTVVGLPLGLTRDLLSECGSGPR